MKRDKRFNEFVKTVERKRKNSESDIVPPASLLTIFLVVPDSNQGVDKAFALLKSKLVPDQINTIVTHSTKLIRATQTTQLETRPDRPYRLTAILRGGLNAELTITINPQSVNLKIVSGPGLAKVITEHQRFISQKLEKTTGQKVQLSIHKNQERKQSREH